MLRSLSPTRVNMGLRCGEQFRRRYFEGERIPPSASAGRGRGVHNAADTNWKQKIESKTDLSESDLLDAARDGFVHAFDNGIRLARDEVSKKDKVLNDMLNQTLRLTRAFRRKLSPYIQPVASEVRLEAEIGLDLPLVGVLDLIREKGVDDIKTTAKSWSWNQPYKELQPPLYAVLYHGRFNARPDRFKYHILVHTPSGKTKLQPFEVKVTDRMVRGALARVAQVHRMAMAGLFPPAEPGHWCCSEKWCGYWLTCKYVGNGARKWA